MSYVRTSATQRRYEEIRRMRYLHVSVQVGGNPITGPTRTPLGKGAMARRAAPKLKGRAARAARATVPQPTGD